MLVLTRKLDERIVIGDNIVVAVLQIQGSTVKLGIEAPGDVTIAREELFGRDRPAAAGAEGGRRGPLSRRNRP